MNIDEMKLGDLKEIAAMFAPASDSHSSGWEVGENYLIRTVTHIQTGRLVAVYTHEIVIEDAAWIADTGRFSAALASGDFSEVEPFPEGRVIVGRGAVVDAAKIEKLPREIK